MSWIGVAALFGTTAVIAGAFGAHGLESRVSADLLRAWNTAAEYQLVHSAVLLALALFAAQSERSIALPGTLFALGMLFFSGSIYLLVLTPLRWIGPLTPLGGLLLIGAWASLVAFGWPRS